jgi:hypothetical protein
MNSWIDLSAVGQILVIGLLAGAGLPALFAVGLRALALAQPSASSPRSNSAAPVESSHRVLGLAVAGVCFLVVLAAIAYGIDIIVNG